MAKIGLNPDTVRSISSRAEAQLGLLDGAQASVQRAAFMSANPLNFALTPGSLILTPWSITQASIANGEIALARASARELLNKLLQEVGAQEFASSAMDGSYETGFAWRTPDASRVPDVDVFDIFNPFSAIKDLVDDVATLYGYGEAALLAAARWAKPLYDDFKSWWKNLPPWAGKLQKFGKYIPILGSGVSAIDLAIAIEEGDVAGGIRHGGSLLIDAATAILAPTGVGALIGAGVGILWDAGWDVADNIGFMIENPMALAEYYQEAPWMMVVHGVAPITHEIWGPLANN